MVSLQSSSRSSADEAAAQCFLASLEVGDDGGDGNCILAGFASFLCSGTATSAERAAASLAVTSGDFLLRPNCSSRKMGVFMAIAISARTISGCVGWLA